MSSKIKGDYLENFIVIYLVNTPATPLTDIYEKFIFQCGPIQKFYDPAERISVTFTEQDSLRLQYKNTCYLAGVTKDGHKETFEGSCTFEIKDNRVLWEPIPSGGSSSFSCVSDVVSGRCLCNIKACFVMDVMPTRVSDLYNDLDYQTGEQVAETVSIHNDFTEAHPYIQSVIASTTESINVSMTEAISVAVAETEAYAVSTVSVHNSNTEAHPYLISLIADNTNSINVVATTAQAYTDSSVSIHNESTEAHTDIRQDITDINDLIPNQASTSNQLADKDFVNSSISTNTANFIGTFNIVPDLEAYSGIVTNNDYAFVINGVITNNGSDWINFSTLDAYNKAALTNFDYAWVVNGSNFDLYRFDVIEQQWELRVSNTQKDAVTLNTAYNRYKATVVNTIVTWDFEYTLNNSSFTASQWAAINSNATATKISQISTNANNISTIQGNYVPKSRTINGKDLSNNITLAASEISGCQTTSNLVTSVSSSSTDAQYPSAKLLYDIVGDIESALNTINSGSSS